MNNHSLPSLTELLSRAPAQRSLPPLTAPTESAVANSHTGHPFYPPLPTSAPTRHRSSVHTSFSSYAGSETSTAPASPSLDMSRPGSRPGEPTTGHTSYPVWNPALLAPARYPSPATSIDAQDPGRDRSSPSDASGSAARDKARKMHVHKEKEHRRRRETNWLSDRTYSWLPAWFRALVENGPRGDLAAADGDGGEVAVPRVSASRTNRGTPAKNAHWVAMAAWMLFQERLRECPDGGRDLAQPARERMACACIAQIDRDVAEAGRNGFVLPDDGRGQAERDARGARRARGSGRGAARRRRG